MRAAILGVGAFWTTVTLALEGCPTTNSPIDSSAPTSEDAYEREVIPGISNGAQLCELPASQLRSVCAYLLARADGRLGTPLTCVDGTAGPSVYDVEACFAPRWETCDRADRSPCVQPVAAALHCLGARIEACVSGATEALGEEERIGCTTLPEPGCVVDRSRAYASP